MKTDKIKASQEKKRLILRGKIVNHEGLYDSSSQCPICLSNKKRHGVLTLQKSPLVELLHCENCKGYSASHMPTPDTLDEFYNNYYIEFDEHKITFHNPERLADHILKYMDVSIFDDKVRILDFGGGDGSISKIIAEKIIAEKDLIVEIALIDKACKTSSYKSSNIHLEQKKIDALNEKYHIVLAGAILEHLPKLNKTIKRLFSLIEVNGYFYARTPYINPIGKLINMESGYPGHVHDMGASFFNRIIETFQLDAKIVVSQPSIVQTEFKKAFLITLIAYLLKFPAYVERTLLKNKKDMYWNFVGGWEVVLQMKKNS